MYMYIICTTVVRGMCFKKVLHLVISRYFIREWEGAVYICTIVGTQGSCYLMHVDIIL